MPPYLYQPSLGQAHPFCRRNIRRWQLWSHRFFCLVRFPDFLALLATQNQRSAERYPYRLWVAALLEDLSASGFVRPRADADIRFKNSRCHLLWSGSAMALRLASVPACEWCTKSSDVELGRRGSFLHFTALAVPLP